jgi:hypothetical protein
MKTPRWPELLGTTWCHRTTGEIALVWRTCQGIELIDLEDATPVGRDPKYWKLHDDADLRRNWQQLATDTYS